MPGDYPNCAVQAANVILNVGHDLMEKPTFHIRPDDGRTVFHLNPFPAQDDIVYFPQHQVVRDMATALQGHAAALAPNPAWDHGPMLRAAEAMQASIADAATGASASARQGYIMHQLREFIVEQDILSVDKGIHLLWTTRNYGTYRSWGDVARSPCSTGNQAMHGPELGVMRAVRDRPRPPGRETYIPHP